MKIIDLLQDQLSGQTILINGFQVEAKYIKKGKGDCICTISDGENTIDLYPQTEFEIL